jgi:hypothetical protein
MGRRNVSEFIKLVNEIEDDESIDEYDEELLDNTKSNSVINRLTYRQLFIVLAMMLSNFLVYIDRFTVAG